MVVQWREPVVDEHRLTDVDMNSCTRAEEQSGASRGWRLTLHGRISQPADDIVYGPRNVAAVSADSEAGNSCIAEPERGSNHDHDADIGNHLV
jgi:hypothetical protein